MKKLLLTLLALPVCAFSADKPAKAAADKADKYQVTGPVVELTDTKIVVMKGTERFEVARNADSKVTGDLKVGSKVTIKYVMTAATVEVKDAAADKPADKAADKGAKPADAGTAPAAEKKGKKK